MEYYAAVSQILPVLYLAIIVEYRWLGPREEVPDPQSPFLNQVVYIAKRFLILLGALTFAFAEISVLRALKDGTAQEGTDDQVILAFAVAGVLLILPLVLDSSRISTKSWFVGTVLAFALFLLFRGIVLWAA